MPRGAGVTPGIQPEDQRRQSSQSVTQGNDSRRQSTQSVQSGGSVRRARSTSRSQSPGGTLRAIGRSTSRRSFSSQQGDSFEGVSLEMSAKKGIQFGSNSVVLVHGWVVGPMLLEFAEKFIPELEECPATVGELCEKFGGHTGPAALVLRTASILNLVESDDQTNKYRLNDKGTELKALKDLLDPKKGLHSVLKRIYSECIPPFDLDSREALYLFKVWEHQRLLWRGEDMDPSFALLFDGAVLTPLLASISFQSRWDDDGKAKGDERVESLNFQRCPNIGFKTLAAIMKDLDLGEVDNMKVLSLSSQVFPEWQKTYDFFVPTAHAQFLKEFSYILMENASWGFVAQPDDEHGEMEGVIKPLLQVGMNWQSQPYHRELLTQVHSLFMADDWEKQPQFIVDGQSTDGSLLALIHEFIKNETSRGTVLSRYPVTYIAISEEEEQRIKTSVTLMNLNIPNKVIKGDLSNPGKAMLALQRAKVDLTKCLHVRAFADHNRTYIPPRHKIAKGSTSELFAKTVFAETIHLDTYGNRILAVNIFQSLIDHLERWATACQGSAGICMMDVMQLSTPIIQKYMNDSAAFGAEILQSLSRQYVVPPVALHLAAGMVGLVPPNPRSVSTYPKHGKYVRMMAQHVTSQNFKIRLAEASDIDKLMELEKHAWAENLRAPREGILRRLNTSPTTCFVMTIQDEVQAVLFTQRIPSLEVIFTEKFQEVSAAHDPNGSIIQLIAINVHPSVGHLGLAQHLRAFALRFAELEPTVKSVCAVTICRDFKGYSGTMEQYMEEHVNGTRTDPVVDFHTGYGAKFTSLVPGYRPEDHENQGIGILIHYHLQSVLKPAKMLKRRPSRQETAPKGEEEIHGGKTKTIELLLPLLEDQGIEVTEESMGQSLFAHGMDSLELVQIRNKISSDLGMDLPSTFLLDYPTLDAVCERLDEMRGVFAKPEDDKAEEGSDSDESASPGGDLRVSEVIAYMLECKKEYATSAVQQQFMDIARKCYPDMLKYILAVEPVLVTIQAPIMKSKGIIETEDEKTVQEARARVAGAISSFWSGSHEVRRIVGELTTLAKLDQKW